jgi:hypothetical protein
MSTRLQLNREFPPVRERPCDAELQLSASASTNRASNLKSISRRGHPAVPGVNHVKRRHLFGLEKGNWWAWVGRVCTLFSAVYGRSAA